MSRKFVWFFTRTSVELVKINFLR